MYEDEKERLIRELIQQGIKDEKVLEAIRYVPRELFVPEVLRHQAYKNVALPIGKGQTISQPLTVAIMTEALRVKKGMKVLEVGTGSGYQAAILDYLGARVFTIERDFDLFKEARRRFKELGLNISTICGDGTLGWNEFAPYDGIIVTAAAPDVPKPLKDQLAIGGRLVIPVGSRATQVLYILTKKDVDEFEIEKIPAFQFVPLIGIEGWRDEF
jgi:protein-L-isoaspartate(D-aspartate) O-methyltransferase